MPKLSEFAGLADRFGGYVLLALAFLVLVWKLVPAPTRAKIELAFPRVAGGARFLAAVLPDVIGALRVGWYQVLAGQPRASVQPPAAQPPRPIEPEAPRGRPGFVRPRALRAAVLLAVGCLVLAPALGAVLAGCPPKYAREPCGASGVLTCRNDQPHQCVGSTTPGWMPIGDEPCSASGQHCEVRNNEPLCVAGLGIDGGAR